MHRVDFLDSESLARLLELEPVENFMVRLHPGVADESGDVYLHINVMLPAHHTGARHLVLAVLVSQSRLNFRIGS